LPSGTPETDANDVAAVGWSATERWSPEGGIDSVQRIALRDLVVSTTDAGAHELGARYWLELERCSRCLVRVRHHPDAITLVLAGMVTLFRFGAAEVRATDAIVECRFPILGGVLVERAGGFLVVAQRSDTAHELDVSVTGYHPRLAIGGLRSDRRFLYSAVQRPLHVAVSRRFLDRAARGLS
jgi:hypothetical protein